VTEPGTTLRAAVFASGGGSNFQSLLDDARSGRSWSPALLITDRREAGAVSRAQGAGVPVAVIPTRDRSSGEVATETLAELEAHRVDVIFLAGYLKLVPREVIARYSGRILNIHPALLPAFGGKGMYGRHVHEAVVAAGVAVTGPTVHLVDEEYDRGAILAQWPVPVRPGDSPGQVAARVLEVEHWLYPEVAEAVCRRLATGRPAAPVHRDHERFTGTA